MSEGKPCPHCGRVIDPHARMCVYCNRDPQAPVVPRAAALPPPPPPAANPIAASVMPKIRFAEQKFGGKVLMIVAALMLLIASFSIGGLYYAFGTKAPKETEDTALLMNQQIPDAAADPGLRTGAPVVTSVPPGTYPVETTAVAGGTTIPSAMEAGADATALPADEYAKIAAQAQRTTTAPTTFQSVDPRTVTTPPPGVATQTAVAAQQPRSNPPLPQPPSPVTAGAGSGGSYERPRPLSQPLPSFNEVQRNGTVRLSLTVGADGRVEEVEVIEGLSGVTARVISAVQRWKFKPATRNGEPVRGEFPVDITFKERG